MLSSMGLFQQWNLSASTNSSLLARFAEASRRLATSMISGTVVQSHPPCLSSVSR